MSRLDRLIEKYEREQTALREKEDEDRPSAVFNVNLQPPAVPSLLPRGRKLVGIIVAVIVAALAVVFRTVHELWQGVSGTP